MLLPHLALTVAAQGGSPQCDTLHGFSWPTGNLQLHLPNVTSLADCCAACSSHSGCGTWTLHPSNGCWLHGQPSGSPKACGDHLACVSGAVPNTHLPPAPAPQPAPPPPQPRPAPAKLATPSAAHLRFHEDNIGAISHFSMQTFAPKADRHLRGFLQAYPASSFDPTLLNTDDWVAAAASFGAKYYVLVTDHFDGFSLYNTSQHNYSVAYSPWKQGRGNIIADFVASCRKFGVRPAFYYSVHENWKWGVSNFNLSTPALQRKFEDMAMQQLAEIKQIFVDGGADVAEIWFDAGVKQSNAFVSRVNQFVKTQLSGATCHSCSNMPDVDAVSWMGNEETVMPYPMWNANDPAGTFDGSKGLPFGIAGGTRWIPAHCDAVLRRHFWFWDRATYNNTKNLNTAAQLLRMHLTSVGRGCNMILDMSPTTTGLLQQNDVDTYRAFGVGVEALYGNATEIAQANSLSRGQKSVTITIPHRITRGAIELRENLTHGQAISGYNVSHSTDGTTFQALPLRNEASLTIGNRRIQYWANVTGGVGTQIRIDLQTIRLASGKYAIPHLRSFRILDWSSAELDSLLTGVLSVN